MCLISVFVPCRLLYSLAFNARFLRHIWHLITSMTTKMITGWVNAVMITGTLKSLSEFLYKDIYTCIQLISAYVFILCASSSVPFCVFPSAPWFHCYSWSHEVLPCHSRTRTASFPSSISSAPSSATRLSPCMTASFSGMKWKVISFSICLTGSYKNSRMFLISAIGYIYFQIFVGQMNVLCGIFCVLYVSDWD